MAYRVRFDEGPVLECSGAAAALMYLRQGGRLVSGSVEALQALARAEQTRLEAGLQPESDR
jgi:hypothetical protein